MKGVAVVDWQSAFNVVAGLCGAIGGWLLRIVWDAMQQLRHDLQVLEKGLPETYARRDDVRDFTDRIDQRFDRIEEKLDRLAEK